MTKEEWAAYQKEWAKNNRDKTRANCRAWYWRNVEAQRERSRKRIRTKEQTRIYNQRYYAKHGKEECARLRTPEAKKRIRAWKDAKLSVPKNRIESILKGVRLRAQKGGLVFDEDLFDYTDKPPTHCLCCNRELDYSAPRRSNFSRAPSFDRIPGSGDYTMKNVAVICMRCNRAKGPATLEELRLLLAYVERETLARGL